MNTLDIRTIIFLCIIMYIICMLFAVQLIDLEHGTRIYAFSVAPITDAGYANLYGRDITVRKKAESQREAALEALKDSENRYRELSIIDDLSQLYNSRHFYDQLTIELERSNRGKNPNRVQEGDFLPGAGSGHSSDGEYRRSAIQAAGGNEDLRSPDGSAHVPV